MRAPEPMVALLLAVAALAGCGGDDEREGAAGVAERAPRSAGDVWEVVPSSDRRTAPAALLAFVHGMHTVVVDDDEVYAGMTKRVGKRGDGDALVVPLAAGLEASLVPADTLLALRFATGDTISMRRRVVAAAERGRSR